MGSLFQTTLVQHLEFGQNLVIKAKAEEDATWFNISLTTGKLENIPHIDIGLHMLVSVTEGVIVFKQCVKDNWKYLKLIEYDTSNFLTVFTINIIMDEQNYHIGVNNEPCIYVKYGILPKRLNTLKINGHLEKVLQVDHRKHFPYLWPPIQLPETFVDFSNELPIPFRCNQVMVLKVKLSGNSKGRLVIQFRNVWEVCREELHMSIRFGAKRIVWNSKLPKENSEDLEYGKEEYDNCFPFEVFSKPFKLAIAFTEKSFKIAKNGAHIYEYAYRTPDVLKDLMGVKMFGTDGVNIRVCSVDHIFLNETQCLDYATYSIMKYTFKITVASQLPEDDTNIDMGLQILVSVNSNMITFITAHNEYKEELHHDFNTAIFLVEFKITIVLSEHNFHIAINNRPCTIVPYSLPLNILNAVKITGHLDYIKQVDHRKYFPCSWPPIQITEEAVDFSNDQPMSFEPGHVMVISAHLLGNSKGRFVLQLKNAYEQQREELHVSVRFDTHKFVRNSKTSKCVDKRTGIAHLGYDNEEIDDGFPFSDFESPFKLAIAFTETECYIAKDGQFLCRFHFRTPNVLQDIVGLKIRGIDGVMVRVSGVEHIQLNDPQCIGFESYSSF
ncbi:Galectin-3 [Lucilia cuprina]|nr:Galectin-3 [Lucilia cuprina]